MTQVATSSLTEAARLRSQKRIDSGKSQEERNRLGQFATPPELAAEILEFTRQLWNNKDRVRFLDPAVGSGSFYSAMLDKFDPRMIDSAVGYEIDSEFADECASLWGSFGLDVNNADFTLNVPTEPPGLANLVICNPPYVRHHHLRAIKDRLAKDLNSAIGMKLSGLAGLYCYFLGLSHRWMEQDAIAAWLIPTEFMDVNYGGPIKDYLSGQVDLIRIHRFDPEELQFGDALVSSCVVWFRNRKPNNRTPVEITYGGSISSPRITKQTSKSILKTVGKWSKIASASELTEEDISPGSTFGDLFTVKRGIATGDNKFFVIDEDRAKEIAAPSQFLTPIIPSSRWLEENEVTADSEGNPTNILRRYVIDCSASPDQLQQDYPKFWAYLQSGIDDGVDQRYIPLHRKIWYSQEKRLPPLFFLTYMTRSKRKDFGFRFILNRSNAIAMNVWLMVYPSKKLLNLFENQPELVDKTWHKLQEIAKTTLAREGRVYGGGLYKLEPRELLRSSISDLLETVPELRSAI